MSISDEDTASTASKRSTKSPPRKIRHREDTSAPTDNLNNSKASESNAAIFETVPLSTEQIVEYARCQVERVLQSQPPCSHLENSNIIAVIPSLVSLSTDFFTSRDNVYADSSHYGGSDAAAAAGAASSASGVTMLDFPSTFPALGTSGWNAFTPSLRPRQQNNVESSGGSFMGEILQSTTEEHQQQQQQQRSVSPPIGPQGAPIPQHILDQMANGNPVDAGSESVARGSNIDTEEFNEPSSPNPRQIFTTDYQNANVQLSAPARLGQSILHTSNQATAVKSSDSKYINVVQSLAEAVKKMEQRLELGENAAINSFLSDRNNTNPSFGQSPSSRLAPSTPRRNNASSLTSTPVPSTPKQALHKDNIDELESSTITQLAEIMLHPPIAKIVKIGDGEEQIVRYVWRDEKKNDDYTTEKTDLDSHMEGNDDTGVQLTNPTFDNMTSKPRYLTSQAAHASIANLGLSIPRRVCQHPFRKNDIVW
jgi:hypothetical protein